MLNIFKRIFDIAQCLFDKQLPKIPFIVDEIVGSNQIGGYMCDLIITKEDPTHFHIVDRVIVDRVHDVTYYPPAFHFFKEKFDRPFPLSFYVNVMVHEMIHQYLSLHGKVLEKAYDDEILHRVKYDQHDKEFTTVMDELNSTNGLNIETETKSIFKSAKMSVKTICEFDQVPITLEQYLEEKNLSGLADISIDTIADRTYDIEQLASGAFRVTFY